MVGNRDRENQDRTNLSLPEHQDDLVSAVAGANPHTVVVLKTGGPVLMPWLDQVSAVLEAWYPGEEDGNVVADLLFGRANPSGKLPLTFPKAAGDTPAHTPEQYPGVNGVATYSERLQVGYRWYDAQRIAPLFPFGFGLSYTSFEVHDLKLLGPRNGNVTVELDVTNTRQRNGTDVAQAYVAYPSGAGEPPKQLRGFAKVKLRARETQHVTMTLNDRAFSVWDTRLKKWSLFPGRYAILVGDSSAHLPLRGEVTVPGPR